jgi:glycosyltransferase involved in cell wall biosynthesis
MKGTSAASGAGGGPEGSHMNKFGIKYIFLQNILTPYRISLFDELHRAGFNFEVYYMRQTEADRHWSIDQSTLRHPFYMDRGFYRMVGRFHLHVNPRLIAKLIAVKDAELILGASWNDLNVLFLVMLKRLGLLRKQVHFWSEANYLTIGARNDYWFKRALRKFVFHASDGSLIIPGKMSEVTFAKWEIRDKAFVRLPNTIEEEKFQITSAGLARRKQNEMPTFLISARLVEKLKGLLNFFGTITDEGVRQAHFLIAGDGPDRGEIQRYIDSRGLADHITLLGHCSTQEMVALYERANAFLLPSLSDQSPLTLVEALRMKLPVLVSDRCGNHFEAVAHGRNGYLFDPLSPSSVQLAYAEFMNRRDEWPAMGEMSAELYRRIFDRKTAIASFMQTLTDFSAAKRSSTI